MIISFSSKIFYSALFYFYFIFESGFTPCADIVNQIRAMHTIGQVVGISLTTLIRHESEKNALSWIIGRDLICFTRGFFAVPAFRLIYTFRVEFFRSLADHCRIFRSSFIGIYALPLASLFCNSFRL